MTTRRQKTPLRTMTKDDAATTTERSTLLEAVRRQKIPWRKWAIGMCILLVLPYMNEQQPPVDFDMYVMAMTYLPEYCFKQRSNRYPGCLAPLDYWKSHLTIHGLWPENRDGTWPQFCSKGTDPLMNTTIQALQPQLQQYWPSVVGVTDEHYLDFWSHEWGKHGTCSGLKQLQYFQTALDHAVETPKILADKYGTSIKTKVLRESFGDGGAVLVCGGGRFLSEVRVCVAMKYNGEPTTRIPCPDVVLADDTCTADQVKLARFPTK